MCYVFLFALMVSNILKRCVWELQQVYLIKSENTCTGVSFCSIVLKKETHTYLELWIRTLTLKSLMGHSNNVHQKALLALMLTLNIFNISVLFLTQTVNIYLPPGIRFRARDIFNCFKIRSLFGKVTVEISFRDGFRFLSNT